MNRNQEGNHYPREELALIARGLLLEARLGKVLFSFLVHVPNIFAAFFRIRRRCKITLPAARGRHMAPTIFFDRAFTAQTHCNVSHENSACSLIKKSSISQRTVSNSEQNCSNASITTKRVVRKTPECFMARINQRPSVCQHLLASLQTLQLVH